MLPNQRKQNRTKKWALLLSLALLTVAVTGTIAYLVTNTDPVTNTFTEAKVPNTPVEEFDGTVKTSIKVKNEGNIDAYVRVKLVTYRVNDKNEHIGGTATIPVFKLGTGWFEQDGYYYYKKPVSPGGESGNLIGDENSIELKSYDDADGGKQVIEVISESIQSVPTDVVEDAWSVTVVNGELTEKSDS